MRLLYIHPAPPSQEVAKLLNRQSRVTGNATHGEGIHRVVARNGHDALTIAHDDVLSLTRNAESGLLQCAHGVEVIDAGYLGQD